MYGPFAQNIEPPKHLQLIYHQVLDQMIFHVQPTLLELCMKPTMLNNMSITAISTGNHYW